MKCDLCKGEVEGNFLNKIKGTYVKKEGKLKVICRKCQSKYKEKLKGVL